LRNPLADPYVLGVSGGASVFSLLFLMIGFSGFSITLAAFVGALFSVILVFGIAHQSGPWSSMRLLLTGVVIAAGWGALISLILVIAPDASLRGMLFWLMGDLSHSSQPTFALLVLAIGLAVSVFFARDFNVMLHGEKFAMSLGVTTRQLNYLIYFLSALLTAAAVSVAGSIGFIGLVVPHITRLIMGGDHRFLFFGVVLLGGMLVVISDTLARTIIAPQQLPVGVITAMIGVPLFLYLLNKGQPK